MKTPLFIDAYSARKTIYFSPFLNSISHNEEIKFNVCIQNYQKKYPEQRKAPHPPY